MELIKKTIEKYPDKVNVSNYLELAKKDENGVPRPTGSHNVTLLKGEMTTRTTQQRGEEEGIMLYFDEEGTEKKYFVPMLNKEGSFHYLFERFADITEGEKLVMEFVKDGMKGYIDVKEDTNKSDDIPVVEDDGSIPIDAYESD